MFLNMVNYYKILKKTITTYIAVIKISGILYLVLYFCFFASIFFNRSNTSNSFFNINLGQALLFLFAFISFLISLLALNFYKSLSKKLKGWLFITIFIQIFIFFAMPLSLKFTSNYRVWIFVFISIIAFINVFIHLYFANSFIKYYQEFKEKDLFVLLFGKPITQIELSEDEIRKRIKYISKQKLFCYILIIPFMNNFVYKDKFTLILFYALSYGIILFIAYLNRRTNKDIAPSIKLLIYIFLYLL